MLTQHVRLWRMSVSVDPAKKIKSDVINLQINQIKVSLSVDSQLNSSLTVETKRRTAVMSPAPREAATRTAARRGRLEENGRSSERGRTR